METSQERAMAECCAAGWQMARWGVVEGCGREERQKYRSELVARVGICVPHIGAFALVGRSWNFVFVGLWLSALDRVVIVAVLLLLTTITSRQSTQSLIVQLYNERLRTL